MEKRVFEVITFYLSAASDYARRSAFHARKAVENIDGACAANALSYRKDADNCLQNALAVASALKYEEYEYVYDFIDQCKIFVACGDMNFLKQAELAF